MRGSISRGVPLLALFVALVATGRGGGERRQDFKQRLKAVVNLAPAAGYVASGSSGLMSPDKFSADDPKLQAELHDAGLQGAWGKRWKNQRMRSEALVLALSFGSDEGARRGIQLFREVMAHDDKVPPSAMRSIDFADEAWQFEGQRDDIHLILRIWRRGHLVISAYWGGFSDIPTGPAMSRWTASIDARGTAD